MTLCKFEILGIDDLNYDYISKLHHNIFDNKSSESLFLADQLVFPRAAKVSLLSRMIIFGYFVARMLQNKFFNANVSLSYPVTDSTMMRWISLAQKESFSFSESSREGINYQDDYYPDSGVFQGQLYRRKQMITYDKQDLPTLKGIDVGDVVYREYIYCIAR